MSSDKKPMIGNAKDEKIGPGGIHCACCNGGPLKDHDRFRRLLKRSERQKWQRELREEHDE